MAVAVVVSAMCAWPSLASAGFGPPAGPTTPPFWQCPSVGTSTSCSFLIELTGSSTNPTVTVYADPSQEFYDQGKDDEIVAVQNETNGPVAKLHIGVPGSGDNLFGFEGDGLCNPGVGATPTGCPFGGGGNTSDPYDYQGPEMAFEPGYSSDDGTVDFNPPLQPSQYTFFGLDAPFGQEVVVPAGAGNDYLTTTLTDVANTSNTGQAISRTAPGDVTDQARLVGANSSSASGTISYQVYSDPACKNLVADATPAPNTVSGSTIPASKPEGSGAAFSNNAIYYWKVTYVPGGSSDQNTSATTACGDETMTFGTPPARPNTGIVTTLSDGTHSGAQLAVAPNTPVTDSATITGTNASTATGTVTYTVFSDNGCTQQVGAFPLHGDIRQVSGGSAPASAAVTLPIGNYYFRAVYSGDASHASAIGTCGAEVLSVRNPSTLATVFTVNGKALGATASVPPGTRVSDVASVLSGGVAATQASGSVSYALYNAALDPSCAKAPAATLANAGVIGGVAAPFAPPILPVLKPGRWLIVASYSGDSQYLPSSSACGSEVLTVVPASVSSKPTVSGTSIVNKVTVNTGGKISIGGTVVNAAALARSKRCGRGKVRVHARCVSNSFGSVRMSVAAAGTYIVKLAANAAARRALERGRTLRVVETITFRPSDGSKAAVRVVRVTVKLKRHRHR